MAVHRAAEALLPALARLRPLSWAGCVTLSPCWFLSPAELWWNWWWWPPLGLGPLDLDWLL